jgi:hypothetical protein
VVTAAAEGCQHCPFTFFQSNDSLQDTSNKLFVSISIFGSSSTYILTPLYLVNFPIFRAGSVRRPQFTARKQMWGIGRSLLGAHMVPLPPLNTPNFCQGRSEFIELLPGLRGTKGQTLRIHTKDMKLGDGADLEQVK